MKKIFTLFAACLVAFAANATDYYFAGDANKWANDNDNYKFVAVDGVLTLEIADLYGELKIVEDKSWHPQHGANGDAKLQMNTPYVLANCNGTDDVPNLAIDLAADQHISNAKLTLDIKDGVYTLTIVSGTLVTVKNYYFAGDANNWANDNEDYMFKEENGVLTVSVPDLYGGFKVTENKSWHPQHGAPVVGEGETAPKLKFNEPYTLANCDGTNDIANLMVDLEDDYRYKNAKLTLTIAEGVFTVTLIAGEKYDHSSTPATYQIVGGFTNNWSTADAIEFVDVEGVLTANVPDLNGTFKIIQDRAWTNQWATNRDLGGGLQVGVPYTMSGKDGDSEPSNLSLANPFGGYKNAVLTLVPGENFVITLVSGEFYVTQADWYFPGTKIGWNINETTKFSPVAGQENTFEFLAAEFSGDFKVVYGNWAVEFGASQAGDTWTIGQHYTMTYPCVGNLNPATQDTYQDVIVTIVVNYENATIDLLIESEGTGVENLSAEKKVFKTIENGQIVIYKDGVKFNVLGTVVE